MNHYSINLLFGFILLSTVKVLVVCCPVCNKQKMETITDDIL